MTRSIFLIICVLALVWETSAAPRTKRSEDVKTSNNEVTNTTGTLKDAKADKEGITKAVKSTQNNNSNAIEKSNNGDEEQNEKADKRQYIPGCSNIIPGYTNTNYMYPCNTDGSLTDTANLINEQNMPVRLLRINNLTIKDGVIRKSSIIEGK
mgnify:CR=1 FL=1